MTAPREHHAVLRHDQVIAAAMAARSRTVSLPWLSIALFLGLIAAVAIGHAATFWLVQRLPFSLMFAIGVYMPTLVPAVLAFLVVGVVGSFQNRAIARAYLANFNRLGIPREIEAKFEVTPEGLRVSTDRITIFPSWAAVDTVERGKAGWVISADQLTFLVPSDSFADADEERAFVAAVVAHLLEEARERSPQAVAFAGAEATEPAAEVAQPAAPPSDVATAKAVVNAQELTWAGRAGFDRVAQSDRHMLAYPLLTAVTGGMAGLVVAGSLLAFLPLQVTLGNIMLLAATTFLLPLIGGTIGLWLGHKRLGTVLYKAYHAALAQRGSPAEAECEWEIGDEGLVTRSDRGNSTTRWEAISEVFRADAHWVVLADLSTNAIPRRAFADETAERAFIGALLAHLPQLARERSGQAAELAAG